MNKTVTINISGIIFHIEEDAFEKLSAYLGRIKSSFQQTEGGGEIMGDIEARIAELLQGKIGPAKQVIVLADVEKVMSVMGNPEDFGSESDTKSNNNREEEKNYRAEKVKRRLFRNPEDKAIGGVCSGLAAYFDIDTVWVRLAMFLLVFFGGVSLWVYIILWIVMPEAKTTADKFAMRGEAANINNIFRSFKEEAEDVKSKINKYGKDFRDQNYGSAVRNNVSSALRTIIEIIGRLFGLFLIFVGGILLFAYVAGLMGISVMNNNTDIAHWRSVIFASPTDYVLAIFAFIVVVGIPVIMIVYSGVRLLFRIRYSNRWLNLGLGILWTAGLLLSFYVGYNTFRQFHDSAKLRETIMLHNVNDTIVIKLNPEQNVWQKGNFENVEEIENFMAGGGKYTFGEGHRSLSILGKAKLNISVTNADSAELIITRSARGFDKEEANSNARDISYTYKKEGNTILLNQLFTVEEGSRFRAQAVDLKMRLPKGTVVFFDKSLKYFLNDVENTSNTWEGNMVNRRWVMTDAGMQCIDCENLEQNDKRHGRHHEHHGDEDITIDEHGIHVSSRDEDIRIDENGIRVRKATDKREEKKREEEIEEDEK